MTTLLSILSNLFLYVSNYLGIQCILFFDIKLSVTLFNYLSYYSDEEDNDEDTSFDNEGNVKKK